MRHRILAIGLAALLAGGCSFLQDWGSLRGDTDGGGMDGGATDAGLDAGPDFDGGDCTLCNDQGCDPSDPSVCRYSAEAECDVCDDPARADESDQCGSTEECESFLVCANGICGYPCETSDDCGASAFGDVCASAGDAAICVGHGCLPVDQECGGWICTLFIDADDSAEVQTTCVPPRTDPPLGRGSVCDPSSDSCIDGATCAADGFCRAYCWPDDPFTCAGDESCSPFGRTYDGQDLGICYPSASPDFECTDASQCEAAGRGDHCAAGHCIQACTTGADCPGTLCVVRDGIGWCSGSCDGTAPTCDDAFPCGDADSDGTFDCYPACDAGGGCPGEHVCIDGVCVAPCATETDCPVAASRCVDVDGDGNMECAPPPI